MAFDFVVLCLLCVAVLAGFQPGLFRSFTLLLACFFSIILSLIFAPPLIQFIEHSFGEFRISYQFAATVLLFFVITCIIFQLLQALSKGEASSYFRMAMGSVFLTILMLFSIGIISGFLQKSGLLKSETVANSHCSRIIEPIQSFTTVLWERAMVGADTIKEKSQQQRQEALSSLH